MRRFLRFLPLGYLAWLPVIADQWRRKRRGGYTV